jgi:hypothetical protein
MTRDRMTRDRMTRDRLQNEGFLYPIHSLNRYFTRLSQHKRTVTLQRAPGGGNRTTRG